MFEVISQIPVGIFILLSALIAAFIALVVPRINRARDEAIKFRRTILFELKEIYPTTDNWPTTIRTYLEEKYPTIQAAVEHYRPFVPFHKRKAYDNAWNIYKGKEANEKGKVQDYFQYLGAKLDGLPKESPQEILNTNVSNLLQFGKKT